VSGPLVDIRGVTHRFGRQTVLSNVSLEIAPGSYTILLGPSGSGKTTLLSILGGFVTPSEGRVFIRGEDCTAVPPARRPTTTVFQDYALFPHMSVGSNVGFGLRMQGVDAATRSRKARETLALVGLVEAFDKKPHQLSGGQRQRVALARALVVEPAVLLLDEPLGALDLKLRRQMQDELKAIQKRVGTAFIHVTHDQEEAMALADHCVVMNDGRIEDEGPAERVYARPATRFSAGFMGESTLIAGTVVSGDSGSPLVETALGRLPLTTATSAGSKVTLAIRPEHLRFHPTQGVPPANTELALGDATVVETVFQGSFKRVLADCRADPSIRFIARLPATAQLLPGDAVDVSCPADDIILLTR
jgi:spermidine/putrescine transport system ATP-binding protein